jgi:hypothetical protein
MISHMRSSCTKLWRIVEEGFKVMDPNNLIRIELADSQRNATALHMIQIAVGSKDLPHIQHSPPPKKLGKASLMCLLAMRA